MKQNDFKDSARVGTATHKKGQLRVAEIIEIASKSLIEDGYSEFTIRKIAAKAKMKHGNLQYYFATKQDLIIAILRDEFQHYQSALQKKISNTRYSAKQKLIFTIDYILRDQEKQHCCVMFWELWALSSHEPEIAQIMDDFYQIYLGEIVNLVTENNPSLKKQKAMKIALLIVSMIEGLSLFRGYNKPRRSYLRGIEKELRATILMLIEQPNNK
ncbi:MAG: TetR/AcrR family transcriptional regulator [Emcibacter sp.]|nr:TetR/AcrR family transcriptional regulator [Emcibacter sp.]